MSTNTKARKGSRKTKAPKGNTYNDLTERVVSQLIAAIEENPDGTWTAPWHKGSAQNLLAPVNATTGAYYQGGNVWALLVTAMDRGYVDQYWATYNQWQAAGSQVRKGEKGAQITKWVPIDDKATGKTKLVPKVYTVHHHTQADHTTWQAPTAEPAPETTGAERLEAADRWIEGIGATILKGGTRAYYAPDGDYIQLPPDETFHTAAGRVATTAHELIHWTGHRSRHDRLGFLKEGHAFGSAPYAREEWVAELGAAIVCARMGVPSEGRSDHAAYLGHWVRMAKEEPKALWSAASKASKAADLLDELAGVGAAVEAEPALV